MLPRMDQAPPSLIDEVDAFLKRWDMAPVTFGRKAMSDPHFVGQLRDGRRLWPETEAKVRKFMREYMPVQAGKRRGATPPATDRAA